MNSNERQLYIAVTELMDTIKSRQSQVPAWMGPSMQKVASAWDIVAADRLAELKRLEAQPLHSRG